MRLETSPPLNILLVDPEPKVLGTYTLAITRVFNQQVQSCRDYVGALALMQKHPDFNTLITNYAIASPSNEISNPMNEVGFMLASNFDFIYPNTPKIMRVNDGIVLREAKRHPDSRLISAWIDRTVAGIKTTTTPPSYDPIDRTGNLEDVLRVAQEQLRG